MTAAIPAEIAHDATAPSVSSPADQIARLTAALEKQGELFARQLADQAAQFTAALAAVMAQKAPQAFPVTAPAPQAGPSFGELWTAYIASLGKRTWTGNMQSMMTGALAYFAPSLITARPRYRAFPARHALYGPDIAAADVRPYHWTELRIGLHAKTATYRNLMLARLRAFFSWAVADGRLAVNPLAKAKLEPKRPRRETTVTEEQLRAILAQRPTPYFRAIMLIAFHTGVRRDEVRTLRWSQVDMSTGAIRLSWTTTKTDKSRTVFMYPEDILALNDLPRRAGVDWVFPRRKQAQPVSKSWLSQEFREACDAAGIQAAPGDGNVHFHDATRHSFGTAALRRGARLDQVQKILGHANLQTTALYLHTNEEDVRAAFDVLRNTQRKPPHGSDDSD